MKNNGEKMKTENSKKMTKTKMTMTKYFIYFKEMFHVLQDISVIWAAALNEIKPRGTQFNVNLLGTMSMWHHLRKEREISKQKKGAKIWRAIQPFFRYDKWLKNRQM